jgi:4-hydroxymandelate synthase
MDILGIDHVEFYVGDAIAAAGSLSTAYGFRVYGYGGPDTGLRGQRSVLVGQEAVASGQADDDLLHVIDHLAVCVPAGTLDSTISFHEQVLGFAVIFQEYIEAGRQGMASKVVQDPSGGVTLTILQPDISRQAGQIDDFLAWHDGAGVQHLASLTDDIARAVATCTDRGVEFTVTPASYYDVLAARLGATDIPVEALRPLGILADRDHWGQMYQIFAKSTHIRRTYFVELIDRHGARTFGANNIPALYAAKERELAEIRDAAGSLVPKPAAPPAWHDPTPAGQPRKG